MITRSIWLPCFKKTEYISSEQVKNSSSLKDLNQIQILRDDQPRDIGLIEQCIDIELKHDVNYKASMKISPSINDVIIKKSFWMIVINHDLYDNNIPLIFSTVIDKKYFVKK